MKKFEWVSMDDGYGVVGVSFYCPHCGHFNTFVNDDFEPHRCEKCDVESMPNEECFEW